jgi:hypothetical protein
MAQVILDPNWVMAFCAASVAIVVFIVWLSVMFADQRIIKKTVIELKKAKHEDKQIQNNHEMRLYILEDHCDLDHP